MPRRQRTTPLNDENSTPPTPSSPNALNHGRLEVWFEGHEDIIQTFFIEINRKQIILHKVIRMSWLRAKNFDTLEQHLKAQKLKTFLELSGKVYPDLVKVFYANLKFNNEILKTSVKGVEMEITRKTWKDVVGLRQRGVQVRKGETSAVDDVGLSCSFYKINEYGDDWLRKQRKSPLDIKITSYLDVEVPFQGSREEEDGLIESKKPKGKTYNRNNTNEEE